MKVSVDTHAKTVTITLPLVYPHQLSKSGKNKFLASSDGWKKNVGTYKDHTGAEHPIMAQVFVAIPAE